MSKWRRPRESTTTKTTTTTTTAKTTATTTATRSRREISQILCILLIAFIWHAKHPASGTAPRLADEYNFAHLLDTGRSSNKIAISKHQQQVQPSQQQQQVKEAPGLRHEFQQLDRQQRQSGASGTLQIGSRAPDRYNQIERRHRRQQRQHHEDHQVVIDDTQGYGPTRNQDNQRRQQDNNFGEQQQPHTTSGGRVSGNGDERQLVKPVVGGGGGGGGVGGGSSSSSSSSPASNGQAGVERIIETAIFIDQALDNKFDGLSGGLVELNKLVLTIMNQVQQLLRYSSLKIPMTIKLVLVEHLKDSERHSSPLPNAERGDIDAYLGNFCNWQKARLEREKRLWWDHAILLSGLDLYKSTPTRNLSGVLGLAWVGGMCRGNYSCTINEASNLESAFVIAHEIGHSLGIMHDGQQNSCDPNGFIMSERTGAGKVHWSRCSNNYLNESIQRNQLSCLETERSLVSETLFDLSKLRAPGQVYSINDQCRLAFGNNYTSFVTRQQPFNAVCKELWCVSGSWAKAAHPALEGSSCGEQDRICHEGKCVR